MSDSLLAIITRIQARTRAALDDYESNGLIRLMFALDAVDDADGSADRRCPGCGFPFREIQAKRINACCPEGLCGAPGPSSKELWLIECPHCGGCVPEDNYEVLE